MTRVSFFIDHAGRTGGVKVAFRHAGLLRDDGVDAVMVQSSPGAPAWFDAPDVPILDVRAWTPTPGEVTVVPEDTRFTLSSLARAPVRRVMLCQNHFLVGRGLDGATDVRDLGIEHVIATGTEIAAHVRRRFPGLPVSVVPLAVDPAVFRPRRKRLAVAVIPRKRMTEFYHLRDSLRSFRPRWRAVPWLVLVNADEPNVAATLGEAAVFLSLARLEGVGLAALEAMACGCLVCGFHGHGGREFATAANGIWVADDDLDAALAALDRALEAAADGTAGWRVAAARETAGRYTPARERRALLDAWRTILGGDGAAVPEAAAFP